MVLAANLMADGRISEAGEILWQLKDVLNPMNYKELVDELARKDTDELRDRIREEALSTTLKDFHDFAPWLAKTLKASVPCALGGSEVENVARANGWATKKLL